MSHLTAVGHACWPVRSDGSVSLQPHTRALPRDMLSEKTYPSALPRRRGNRLLCIAPARRPPDSQDGRKFELHPCIQTQKSAKSPPKIGGTRLKSGVAMNQRAWILVLMASGCATAYAD